MNEEQEESKAREYPLLLILFNSPPNSTLCRGFREESSCAEFCLNQPSLARKGKLLKGVCIFQAFGAQQ
jgi:hypothetical protein